MKLQRTAGPLGRKFGFAIDISRFSIAFNAGWYVFSLRFRGVGYVQFATRPFQMDWYSSRFSK